MRNLVPIGRFSQLSRLTVKALRHYDEIGLLRPAVADPDSGYRYYSLSQAAEAERIRLLRTLGMPLEEIREVLREREPQAVRALLDRHRERIEREVEEHRRALVFLEKLMDAQEGEMAIEVKVKETTVLPMLSIRARTSLAEMGPHMQGAYGELFAYLGEMGLRPTGPPFSVYHDPEFREDDIDVETCVPVDRLVAGRGRVHGGRLPASPIAYTLHVGPYDEIGPAYQALAGWIQKHGHEMVGPPREVYLVGPDRAKEPSDYRTELQWPIR